MVTRMLTVHLNNKLEHHYELQHCNGYKTILFFVYICNIYGSRSIGFISYFTHERMASYTQLFMVNVGFVYVPLTYKSMLICWDTPVFLFLWAPSAKEYRFPNQNKTFVCLVHSDTRKSTWKFNSNMTLLTHSKHCTETSDDPNAFPLQNGPLKAEVLNLSEMAAFGARCGNNSRQHSANSA